MKYLILLVIGTLINATHAFAQKAKITVSIKNEGNAASNIYAGKEYADKYKKEGFGIYQKNGVFTKEFPIDKPMSFTIESSGGMQKGYFSHDLIISPGDDIFISYDLSQNGKDLKITGKGVKNNLYRSVNDIENFDYRFDENPGRLLQVLKENDYTDSVALADYIKQYQPVEKFITFTNQKLKYKSTINFISCYREKLVIRHPPNEPWTAALDSMVKKIDLNNKDVSTHYKGFINSYVNYKVVYYKALESANPKEFYKSFYGTDSDSIKLAFHADKYNLVEEKIILDEFDKEVQDYLYYSLVRRMMNNNELNNFSQIVDNYKSKFPNSSYRKELDKKIAATFTSLQKKLNDKMILVKDGEKINTLEEVINLYKGKAVFIDMWGTWCAPCLQSIERNTPKLKEHFKNKKDLIFLYISNHDSDKENVWKEKIAFHEIEGKHILANRNLTDDIMTKVESKGYPTFITIDKNGVYKKIKTNWQNIDELIKEVENNIGK